MSNVPKFDLRGATIGNLAETVQGDQIAHLKNASEQKLELLLTDYKQFIDALQQKYPTLADPTTVPQIIEVEAKLIETQDHQRWQNFLNLKRLWNGSKKAGVKVGEHFAENNVWAKGAVAFACAVARIAFLEGISEDAK